MVHTAQFYCQLNPRDVCNMVSKHNMSINLIPGEVEKNFNGFSGAVIKEYNYYKLTLTVDFIKMLNKTNINESDYEEIERKIDSYMNQLCGLFHKDLTLIRLDYRFDIKLKSKQERNILINLYKKLINKRGFKNKSIEKTTIYYNTKSTVICIYDKEEEARKKRGEILSFEENTIRFEYRLYNRHLNNNKYNKKMDKSLKSYLSNELFMKYMLKNIEPILYRGDYYKIFKAKTIINKSRLSEKDKSNLIEFLNKTSKQGITKVRNATDSSGKLIYSKYKFSKIISQLEELGVNPILIPKNIDGPSFIENPFKYHYLYTTLMKTA